MNHQRSFQQAKLMGKHSYFSRCPLNLSDPPFTCSWPSGFQPCPTCIVPNTVRAP